KNFKTHTGWFFGVRGKDPEHEVEAVNGASSLRLRGQLRADGGFGALTLADGSEHRFDVVPAHGSAGVFLIEEAGDLLRLIWNNDGQTAGNVVTRTTTTGVAPTAPTSPTSTPVTATPIASTATLQPVTFPITTTPTSPTSPTTTPITTQTVTTTTLTVA